MAEYSNDEERLLAIVDFFKHYRKICCLKKYIINVEYV